MPKTIRAIARLAAWTCFFCNATKQDGETCCVPD